MVKKVYISKNYSDKFTASSKAKYDCEVVAESCGYRNIGLPRAFFSHGIIGRLWTVLSNMLASVRMPENSFVFVQYPVAFFDKQVLKAKKRNNKVVVIIHDLNALRGTNHIEHQEALMMADTLIVHSNEMKNWCKDNLSHDNCIVLGVFDYLYDEEFSPKFSMTSPVSIAFAGNLGKSDFLENTHVDGINFNLFGVGADKKTFPENMLYKGCFPPDKLWQHLDSMYGLVWDGVVPDTCEGIVGVYLRYIAPHKLSLYLSCGIPVIVWSKSAMAEFVKENKIGIVCDSLLELDQILSSITEHDYKAMVENVSKVRQHIIGGDYCRAAMQKFEHQFING